MRRARGWPSRGSASSPVGRSRLPTRTSSSSRADDAARGRGPPDPLLHPSRRHPRRGRCELRPRRRRDAGPRRRVGVRQVGDVSVAGTPGPRASRAHRGRPRAPRRRGSARQDAGPDAPHRGKQIAMVLQDPMTSLNPGLTIGTLIAEVVRRHQGLRGAPLRARVLEALSRLRIPGAASRLAQYQHQLSGGMRQRVTSAIAMSCAPRVLIADEPTTSLDVTIQAQYLELLDDVQRATGVAIILVTHDFGIVAAIADRVAVMYAGRIVEIGRTTDIFDHPAHPYTRALLRCLPDVELKRERLIEIGGQPPDLARLPPGCPFASRCPERQSRCEIEYPPAVSMRDGHMASCWAVPALEARAG